jgi:hypothetical protein
MLALIATAMLAAQAGTAAPPVAACVPQPLPPAIDSAGALPAASDTIEFAATPSLQVPGRAWVVRLTRRGTLGARLEVFRLLRQHDCNRYDVESRWEASLPQPAYAAVAARVAALGVPDRAVFVPQVPGQVAAIALDGTSLDLRLRTTGWEVRRSLAHHDAGGAALSALFRDLASRCVPVLDMPMPDWRRLAP